ncbi:MULTISPECIES: PPE domain-containing protein [Rhodococcus]|uniref:PPE domain-containing protein n=1 Tax=Rhodococcus cercidiphylli TaxID=489916 RepID=A0ABU4B0Y3_9NOCA|nr:MULTISPECIES: PPE domain-containing protein [Rhodococcus]KAA0922952.1 PPE domain-containing protein [Rhodococcus sp. ANT_H53B]MDV6232153.1 PPE domain-containing protein [Rhodococcus cercidiphylli]MDV7990282.1 PPE domain-containing protein [Rhodococcus sp. IEGM 1374]
MTLGVTGVVWLPRTATGNSTRLLGPGPVPLHVAGGAWGSVAAAFTEASASIAAVTAALTAGWEGESALLAQAALGRFATWTAATAVKAAALSVEAPAAGTSYGVALATMPSLVEIGAVQAAKVTAASTGGVMNGSYEAAEVADRLLDIRAALVMEGFELVSSHRIVQTTFDQPPAIVSDSGSGLGKFANGALMTSPVQAAIGGLMAATQNPGVAAAAGQIGSAATSIASTGVSTVATAASTIGSSALSGGVGAGGGFAPGGSTSPAVGPASTRPVSFGGAGGAAGLGGIGGGVGMPGSALGPAGGGSMQAGAGQSGPSAFGAPTSADAGLAQRGTGAAGAPASGTRGQAEDDEHETPDYLKQFEHFSDGRTVAPSVIGADPTLPHTDTSRNGR